MQSLQQTWLSVLACDARYKFYVPNEGEEYGEKWHVMFSGH